MHARFALIAAATVMSASAFAAEPSKPSRDPGAAAKPASAQIVLASAEMVRVPAATEEQAPAPAKKPRIARVTSCRCGDAPAQPEQ